MQHLQGVWSEGKLINWQIRQHALIFPPAQPRPRGPLSALYKPHASRRQLHCRHLVTPGGHMMESSAAVCSVRPTAHASPCQWGWLSIFSFFLSPVTLTFELGRYFCTMHLTAEFHIIRLIVRKSYRADKQTQRQTDAAENIHLASLRYAGGYS